MAAERPLGEEPPNTASRIGGAVLGTFTGFFAGLGAGFKKMGGALVSGFINFFAAPVYYRAIKGHSLDEIWEIQRAPINEQFRKSDEIIAKKQAQNRDERTGGQIFADSITAPLAWIPNIAGGVYNFFAGIGTALTGSVRGAQLGLNYGVTAVANPLPSGKLFKTLDRAGIEVDKEVIAGQRPVDHSLKTDWTAQGAINALNKGAGVVVGAVTGALAGVGAGIMKSLRGIYTVATGWVTGVIDKAKGFSTDEVWEIQRSPLGERDKKRAEILARNPRPKPSGAEMFYNVISGGLVTGALTGIAAGAYNVAAGAATALTSPLRGAQLGWKYGASEVINPFPTVEIRGKVSQGRLYNTLTNPGTDAENVYFDPARNVNAAQAAGVAAAANEEVRPAANSVVEPALPNRADAPAVDANADLANAAENLAEAEPDAAGADHPVRNVRNNRAAEQDVHRPLRVQRDQERDRQQTGAPELISGNRNIARARYNSEDDQERSFNNTRNRNDSSISQPNPMYTQIGGRRFDAPPAGAGAAALSDPKYKNKTPLYRGSIDGDSTYADHRESDAYSRQHRKSSDDYSSRSSSASRDYRALSDASDDNRSHYGSPITHQHTARNNNSGSLRAIARAPAVGKHKPADPSSKSKGRPRPNRRDSED